MSSPEVIEALRTKLQTEMREWIAKGGVLVRGAWGVETHPETNIVTHVPVDDLPYFRPEFVYPREEMSWTSAPCACALGAGIPNGYIAPAPLSVDERQQAAVSAFHGLPVTYALALATGFDGGACDGEYAELGAYWELGVDLERWAFKELGYVDTSRQGALPRELHALPRQSAAPIPPCPVQGTTSWRSHTAPGRPARPRDKGGFMTAIPPLKPKELDLLKGLLKGNETYNRRHRKWDVLHQARFVTIRFEFDPQTGGSDIVSITYGGRILLASLEAAEQEVALLRTNLRATVPIKRQRAGK